MQGGLQEDVERHVQCPRIEKAAGGNWRSPIVRRRSQDAQDRAFRRLRDVLVYNYPGILQNPGPTNELIPTTTPSHDIWHLAKREGLYQLVWSPVNGIDVVVGTVATTQQATKAARHLTGNKDLQFHRHVWLDDVTSLWRTDSLTKVEDVRDLLRLNLTTTGLEEVEQRKERWGEWNQSIAAALDEVHWNDILQMPGAPAAHRLLLHRIKGGRITGWSPALQAVACPHCPELGAGGGRPDHIFWDCPNAQRLWAALQQRWTHLWTPTSRADLSGHLRNVFSLKLDVIPSKLWEHHEITRLPKPTPDEVCATHQAIQAAWRMQVLATLHVIWRWRTDADSADDIWTKTQARAYQDGCLRATLVDLRWARSSNSAASCHTAAALKILNSRDPENEIEPATTNTPADRQYVLFFDGGSRGNPGPGGSGAVIVQTNRTATTASIIWSAAMSSANKKTTNNQAEYRGVLEGLRAAHKHQWLPLDVVGDSQLILGQLQRYKPPRNQRLRHLYAEARRLGDMIGVRRWIHHLRAFNKMADAVANAAMDSSASSQVHHPTTRPEHVKLARHLESDFAHWQAHYLARLVAQ